jgi:hypothetical protein
MDFGRKGDNKRAMNLMWKNGISLKDAWAIVQGRKKGSSRKNCFGVGSGVEGYEINPETGRMRKICEHGRNPDTGRCYGAPRAFKPAPEGYEYNLRTGRYLKICEHGRNPATGRCFPRPQGMVPDGYTLSGGRLVKICKYGRDPITGKCNKKPIAVPATPPAGYEYLSDGRLRKMCTYGRDPLTLKCFPKPKMLVGIPDGYERSSTGRLRLICNPATHYRNAKGRCLPLKKGVSDYYDALEAPDINTAIFSTNPFETPYLDTDPFPSTYNPFEDDKPPVVYDEDDFDPFGFGKKYKKPKRRNMRSCFGSCSECNALN